MQYFGGAPLELPLPADPGIILFLFFSSASATAFIILSWSMAALTNSLYDKLERCTRRSCRLMVQVGILFIRVDMVGAILSQGVELPRVVKYIVVPLLKVQELLQLAAEQSRR
jgi:hypothetical protein